MPTDPSKRKSYRRILPPDIQEGVIYRMMIYTPGEEPNVIQEAASLLPLIKNMCVAVQYADQIVLEVVRAN